MIFGNILLVIAENMQIEVYTKEYTAVITKYYYPNFSGSLLGSTGNSWIDIKIPFTATVKSTCKYGSELVENTRIESAVTKFVDVIMLDGMTGVHDPSDDSNLIIICPEYDHETERPKIIIRGTGQKLEHHLVHRYNYVIERISNKNCESLKFFFKNGTFFSLEYTRLEPIT